MMMRKHPGEGKIQKALVDDDEDEDDDDDDEDDDNEDEDDDNDDEDDDDEDEDDDEELHLYSRKRVQRTEGGHVSRGVTRSTAREVIKTYIFVIVTD